MKSVDLIIPVYNEEKVLAQSVATLREWCQKNLPYKWRVVVADNASKDGTLAIAQQLAAEDPDGTGFIHLDQKGRGRALKKAWLESTADAMCYMDVDLSTDLAMITPLLSAVLEDGYDIAYGSRVAKGSDTKRSLKREINSRGYITLFKLLFQVKFSDAQCGFKAITRQAAQALIPQVQDVEWFFDTELLVIAEKRGWQLKEVPVKWVEDPDTRTQFPRDVIRMARDAFRLRRRGWRDVPAKPTAQTST
jgi:glycosyltransferase involved in cell wall biosynthesis